MAVRPVTLPNHRTNWTTSFGSSFPDAPLTHGTSHASPPRTSSGGGTTSAARRRRAPRPTSQKQPWEMTPAELAAEARRRAQDIIRGQIGGLRSESYLRDQQAQQSSGIANLTGAANRLIGANNDAFRQSAAGVAGGFGAQFAQNTSGNGGNSALSALGQQTQGAKGGDLLAAMGQNIAGGLQGAQNAMAASGAAYQRNSLSDLASQINARNDRIAGIQGQIGSLTQQQRDSLLQQIVQHDTLAQNAAIAAQQFGLKQDAQSSLDAFRQGQLQNSADRNAISASTAEARLKQDWAKFQASLQAKYDLSGGAGAATGSKQRSALLKDVRNYVTGLRNKTSGVGKAYVYKFKIVDQPAHDVPGPPDILGNPGTPRHVNATYRTVTQNFQAASPEEAQRLANQWNAAHYRNAAQTVYSGQTGGGTKRVYNDNQIVHQAVAYLTSQGMGRNEATNVIRSYMGLAPLRPRKNQSGTAVPGTRGGASSGR